MSDITKGNNETIQRSELHKKIWAIADDVRGAVDGWDFKQYILGILFYRFISENITEFFNSAEHEAGDLGFDYAEISDEEAEQYFRPNTVEDKGFFILPSQLFKNVVKNARDNENLNTDLANIFKAIEGSAVGFASEDDIKGLFEDVDTTSNRLGGTVAEKNKRLADILIGIAGINFGNFQNNDIDAFGDAYEYLISNYASNAGKSGGEFFTPQTVSKLLARLVMDGKTNINKVYDPTCGSGSLLLQMKKQFDEHIIEEGFFGQEINMTNFNLARMNMFLHNVNYNNFSIKRGDTLINPLHRTEKPFDAIVSNPPYSIKWVGDADPTLINDERFAPAGKLAPKSYADYAFIMHSLSYLSSKGRAAIVCFPGIFYRKGAEKTIRQYLVDNNFIDCIIQLPENLFFGTTIATCILVMAKNKTENKILFIDASKEFKKETNNNILDETNIKVIIEEFKNRTEKEYFSRYVDKVDIQERDYNLSVSTYVEKEDTREVIDIKVLNKGIEETVKKIDKLRSSINKIIKNLENEKINELLKNEKIEWIELECLLDYEQPSKYIVKSTEYSNDYDIPVLTAGQTFILGYTNEKDNIYKADKNNPVIIFDDFTAGNHWVDFNFKVKSSAMKILRAKEGVNLRYCYHCIKTIRVDTTEHKRLWISHYSQIKIPIPSIETQEKIVKILDKFTNCVTELQAELQARTKQYECYRDKLLDFKRSN